MTGFENEMPPGYMEPINIGHGGWADVYRCTDRTGNRVALKLFRDRLADPTDDRDFRREFAVAAALSAHPGTIGLHEGGVTVAQRPWLALEFASRGSVAGLIASVGSLPLDIAMCYAVSIADTLAWAHSLATPVIHGDIKPANILIDAADRPRLTDFGAARFTRGSRSVTVHQLAQTHAAPEVLVEGRATPVADVWSLAATLFEMLTGNPPFMLREAEGVVAFANRVQAGLPADAIPASVPEQVADVLRGGLTADRAARTSSMAEFAWMLRSAQEALSLPVTPGWPAPASRPADPRFITYAEALAVTTHAPLKLDRPAPAAPRPPRSRRPVLVVASIAAVGLLLAGAGFAFAVGGDEAEPPRSLGATATPATSATATATAPPQPSATVPSIAPSTGGVPTTPTVARTSAGPAANVPPPAPAVPGVISTFSIADSSGVAGLNGKLAFSITPPASTAAIQRYELEYTGDATPDLTSTATSGQIQGLTNGTTYSVRVRACASQCAAWSGSRAGQPYGPVPNPGSGASKSGDRQIQLSWSAPGTNGRPLSRLEIRVDGGGWENVGVGNGSRIVGNGPNQGHSIQVRAFDQAGQESGTTSANATTSGSWVNVSPGSSAQGQPGCSSSACRYITVELRNFASNTSYSCSFNSSLGSDGFITRNFTTDGNGNAGPSQTPNYFGVASGWVTATCGGVAGTRSPWL
ncbi:protein kinase [Catellatospora sp. KI3]|uniref:protein kinase domain-containing protein n=1 Tax=Catellatospora sp. KI3 TaxID=3041620 RepID=UPI002482CC6F|nr:protein kinase [Catellatospora sp. KI3]MDI1460638.1 protein kinase [Catellatospora sp. KI3]